MFQLRSAFLAALPCLLAGGLAAQEPEGTHVSRIGNLTVTTLLDTRMQLPTTLLKGIDQAAVDQIYQKAPTVTTSANAFLVRTDGHLVLVDTGGSKAMNPLMGNVQARLAALGVKPESIEAVYLTHGHGDHTGGLLAADGQRAFPNAVVRLDQDEDAYWANADGLPDARKPMAAALKATLAPYRAAGKLQTFRKGDTLPEGARTIPVPGHTPGSTIYVFPGTTPFWAVGDIVHFGAVQFQHPKASVGFDWDGGKAVAAREAIWKRAAREGAVLGAAHLDFPGVGHVVSSGQAFAWAPLEK